MAISVDWPNKIINIPKADTQLVQSMPTEIRQLDLDVFRLTIADLQDDEDGMIWLTAVKHTPPVVVGGVALARVVELINGYTVTFEDGQYAVNLVGANSNVGDNVNVNQVSIRSANSAGLTYSKQVEDQSFEDGRVWINTNTGLSGTQFPRGTPGDPVSNLADAQTIISSRTLPKRIHLAGSIITSPGDDLSNYDILGASPILSSIDLDPLATSSNMIVERISLTGEISGDLTGRESTALTDIVDFSGSLHTCGIGGNVTLAAGTGKHEFVDCYSEVAGVGVPILDCNSLASLSIYFRRYTGGIDIRNFNQAGNSLTIDLLAGNVIIDSSCTAGTIVLRGIGDYEDNSGVGCTVVREGFIFGLEVQEIFKDLGLDINNPKSITELVASTSYDEVTDAITKQVRKVGSTTTITRQ